MRTSVFISVLVVVVSVWPSIGGAGAADKDVQAKRQRKKPPAPPTVVYLNKSLKSGSRGRQRPPAPFSPRVVSPGPADRRPR